MWTVKRRLNLSPVSYTGWGKPSTRLRMWVCVYILVCTGEDWWEMEVALLKKKKRREKRGNQKSSDAQGKSVKWCSCQHNPHPPCCVTLFCCTVCRSWRRCWTTAAESAAGTGPVGTASEGWSRGSGWPGLNQCAGYSQWDRKLRKMWKIPHLCLVHLLNMSVQLPENTPLIKML